MSIEKANAYVTTEGQAFLKLEDAQKSEIVKLLQEDLNALEPNIIEDIADALVRNGDQIVSLLTLTPHAPKKGRPKGSRNKGRSLDAAIKEAAEAVVREP